MTDEVLVVYKQDISQVVESTAKMRKEYIDTEVVGKKTFSNIGGSSEQAAKSIDKVSQSAAKAKSSFNGLNNSIAQISRELPNFAMNAQVGFLAISNNLPILADAIANVRKQNAELVAQGKDSISVWKQVGSAIFGWQTALTVGITLLTLYGSKIVSFVGELIKGSSSLDQTKLKVDALNEAFGDDGLKKSITDYIKLQAAVKAAKEGFTDKDVVLKQYNDTIGKTLGTTNNLNAAEINLARGKDQYLKSVVERIAANNLFAKAAELMIEKAETQTKGLGVFDYIMQGARFAITGRISDTAKLQEDRIKDLDRQIQALIQSASQLYKINIEQPATKEPKAVKETAKKVKQEKDNARDEDERARIAYEQAMLEYESLVAKNRLDAIRKQNKDEIDLAEDKIKTLRDIEKDSLNAELKQDYVSFKRRKEILEIQLNQEYITRAQYAEATKKLEHDKAQAIISSMMSVASIFGSLSVLIGQNTADGKALAIAETTIDTYVSAQKAYKATVEWAGPIVAALAAGAAVVAGLARVAQIQAVQIPAPKGTVAVAPQTVGDPRFAQGVVDLAGPGTGTSDSISARLSRGESVMTAKATKAKKDELTSLNYSVTDYNWLIENKYVKPALEKERRKQAEFAAGIVTALNIKNSGEGKMIVKAINKNKPASAKDIRGLAQEIDKSNKERQFLKNNFIGR